MAHRLRELVLWAGAALGLLAVIAGLAVVLGGFSFLVFRSGSMSPEIPTGGLALSRTVAAADIRPGDIVSVTAASGERVTHRVVESTLRGDEASLVLKGDANATPDSEVYAVRDAERIVTSVPWGGYVVAHALTPPGLVALGALSLMLILLTTGRRDEEDPHGKRIRPRHRGRVPTRRRVVAGGALLAVVAGSGAAVAHTAGTLAAFTDAPRGTTSATAFTLPSPTMACADGSTSLSFAFPAATMPGRTITYDATLNTGAAIPVSGTGATRTFTVNSTQAPGALFATRRYVVTVTARTTTNPVWTAAAQYNISTYGTILVDMSCDGPVAA